MMELLPLAKGEHSISYDKVPERINATAKECRLNCHEIQGNSVYQFARYKPKLSVKVHKLKQIKKGVIRKSVSHMRSNNTLSWPKFAEHLNAIAQQRGLKCRGFTRINIACIAPRNNSSLPSGWTKIGKDLFVEDWEAFASCANTAWSAALDTDRERSARRILSQAPNSYAATPDQ